MKGVLYSFIVLLLAVSSCKKSDSLADIIVGKWQLVSTSTANIVQTPAAYTYVKFNNDGSLSGNAFPGGTSYKFDANAKTLIIAGGVTYVYFFDNNQLVLSLPNALVANEQRYKKVP